MNALLTLIAHVHEEPILVATPIRLLQNSAIQEISVCPMLNIPDNINSSLHHQHVNMPNLNYPVPSHLTTGELQELQGKNEVHVVVMEE